MVGGGKNDSDECVDFYTWVYDSSSMWIYLIYVGLLTYTNKETC